MISKSSLAVALSQLKGFTNPKMNLEQYATPSELAASVLHHAAMQGDIQDQAVVDLGCGTGVLGIGAGILQAASVTFLDIDEQALGTLQENLAERTFPYEVVHAPLKAVEADVVVMNPPFGTKHRHADKQFLLAAMRSAPIIYSIHLKGSEAFIDELCAEQGFVRTHTWSFSFPIPKSMPAHTKSRVDVDVVAVRLQQQRL